MNVDIASVHEFTSKTKRDALFCAFKDRELNPEGYDWKFSFWRQSLEDIIRDGKLCDSSKDGFSLCFSKRQLQQLFTIDGVYPLVFDTLITSLQQTSTIKDLYSFQYSLQSSTNYSLRGKLYKLAAYASSFLRWKQRKSDDNDDEIFVHVDLVAKYSKEIQKILSESCHSYSESVFTEEQMKKIIQSNFPSLSPNDTKLLVTYMTSENILGQARLDNNVIVYYLVNGEQTSAIHTTNLPANTIPITVVSGVGLVKVSLEKISLQIHQVEDSLMSTNLHLSTLLSQKDKAGALKVLRRKKMLQAHLERLESSHARLEDMLFSVDKAQTDSVLYNSLHAGLQSAQKIMKTVPQDSLADILEGLDCLKEDQREISQILSPAPPDSDEADELEREYQCLVEGDVFSSELDDIMGRLKDLNVSSVQKNPNRNTQMSAEQMSNVN